MSKSSFEDLIEASWRRPLTPDEENTLQAWLSEHPEDADRWELEAGISLALETVPVVQPSSNFTSQVLAMIERDARAGQKPKPWWASEWLTLRRLSWAAACLIALAIASHESDRYGLRQVNRGVGYISTVAAVTPPELLEDFEVVQQFNAMRTEANPTDEALYVLLAQ